MDDHIDSAYSEARTEYIRHLLMHIGPVYFNFFLTLYDQAKEETVNEPKKCMWRFQTLLTGIPDWNMERVRIETDRIEKECDCDYLEDLLTAAFIAYTKVLTAIRLNTKNKKVNITVPKIDHFLFKALCECARILWMNTYLFREDIPNLQKQQNFREVEKLVHEGITQAVRSMTPVRSILKDCISDSPADAATAEPTTSEPVDAVEPADTVEPVDAVEPEIDVPVTAEYIPISEPVEAVDTQGNSDEKDIKIIGGAVEQVQEGAQAGQEEAQELQSQAAAQEEAQELQSQAAVQEEAQELQSQAVEQEAQPGQAQPSVSFTNYNTIFTIDEPDNVNIAYDDPDMESVSTFDTDNELIFDDTDSVIEADTIDI